MARPREFNIDEALDAAMQTFWQQGYAGTSMSDLMAAMQLEKGSIYKAWKGKQDLYLAALERYLDQGFTRTQALFDEATDPRQAIEDWLGTVVEHAVNPADGCRGCFAVNTQVELGPHDGEATERVTAHQARMLRLVTKTVAAAQSEGQLRADIQPTHAAELIWSFVAGLMSAGRGSVPRARARRLVASLLQLLS